MDVRFIGERFGDLPCTDELEVEIGLSSLDDRVMAGTRRVELWAGVCGLEALPGTAAGLLGIVAGFTGMNDLRRSWTRWTSGSHEPRPISPDNP